MAKLKVCAHTILKNLFDGVGGGGGGGGGINWINC